MTILKLLCTDGHVLPYFLIHVKAMVWVVITIHGVLKYKVPGNIQEDWKTKLQTMGFLLIVVTCCVKPPHMTLAVTLHLGRPVNARQESIFTSQEIWVFARSARDLFGA